MERCSTLLIITEMQIKTTIRYHLPPIRVATLKKNTNNECCQGKGTLIRCWWECKLMQTLWKTVETPQKKIKIELPYDPATPLLLGMYPKKKETNLKRSVHM